MSPRNRDNESVEQPPDTQDEGRTLSRESDQERPVMEDLGRGEAPPEEHGG